MEVNMDALFSPEEINKLHEKTDPKELEKFFLDIFLKKGDDENEARERARIWAQEMSGQEIK